MTLYEKIRIEMNQWPDWKKQYYNDHFAVTKNSIKLVINNEGKKS